MKLLAALQREAQKLTKAKASLERQLNAISAAAKAFGSTLAAESANGRKKRGRRKGHKMSAAGRKAIAEAQRLRWAKQKKEKAKGEKS
jgi:imidazole glycerol phosphate synthase subunit HisF